MGQELKDYAVAWQAMVIKRNSFHAACDAVENATPATARDDAGRYTDTRSAVVTAMAELVIKTVNILDVLPAIIDDVDGALVRDAVGTHGDAPLPHILRPGTLRGDAVERLSAATKSLLEACQHDLARIPLDRVVVLANTPRPRGRVAAAVAAVALGLGAAIGAAGPAQAATVCAPGETPRMVVVDAAAVTADRSSFPAWRTTVPGGEVVCQTGDLDSTYQDILVRVGDGREGIAFPQNLAALPGPLPATFSYAEEAVLVTGELHAFPSTSADALDASAGTTVLVDRSFAVEGPDGFGTARFVPARTEAGVEGWVVDAELAAPEPEPEPESSEPVAAPGPELEVAGPPAATDPDEGAPFEFAAWLAAVPVPVWVAGAVAAGVVGMGALFIRRKRYIKPTYDGPVEMPAGYEEGGEDR